MSLFSRTILAVLTLLTMGQSSPAKPNVLFLLSDDQRPDTIAALGNPHIKTPNLDALTERGMAFTRAVCANPICTPSRGEILSGCSGFRNGVVDFGGRLDPNLTLWPQAMQKAGYRTYYVGKWHNDGKPRERGFDETRGLFMSGGGKWWKDQEDWKGSPITGYRGWVFRDDEGNLFPDRGVGLTSDISSRFADAAIEVIDQKSEKPFFLQVSFTAPHDPLIMPPDYEKMYPKDQIPLPKNFLPKHPFDHGNYDGRDEKLLAWPRTPEMVQDVLAMYYRVITHMDAQVGRIINALKKSGQLENTIVIFSSDHGLGVGSHGLRGKQSMYEHTINVPLIIAGPGVPEGKQSDAQVYLREMYPTTCDLVGIPIPESVQGISFAPVIRGDATKAHSRVFCYFRDKQRMVRTDRWKLIRYPAVKEVQLFDLQDDPDELRNLASDPKFADVRRHMESELRAAQMEFNDPLER